VSSCAEAVAISVDLTQESSLLDLHTQPDPTHFSSQYRVVEKLRIPYLRRLVSLAAGAHFVSPPALGAHALMIAFRCTAAIAGARWATSRIIVLSAFKYGGSFLRISSQSTTRTSPEPFFAS
jgi:hypothetical protein